MDTNLEVYEKLPTCYTGKIDNFGFAFVPGGEHGVVLLDASTQRLLENLSGHDPIQDRDRINLLLKYGLIRKVGFVTERPSMRKFTVRGLSTWLHVMNNCNLGCEYCYIAYKNDLRAMPLSVADAFLNKLQDTAERHQLTFVHISFAGGEPTMNRRLVEYVSLQCRERFDQNGVKSRLRLLTNGTLLDKEWISFLQEREVQVCISLDGIQEHHDVVRPFKTGKGSFAQAMAGIDLCVDAGLSPAILTTITEKNIRGIPELNRYLIDRNLPFRYSIFRDSKGGYEGYKTFNEEVVQSLHQCYDYYAEAIRAGSAVFAHQLGEIHIDQKPHLRACNVGFSGVTVDHKGDVYFCQAGLDRSPIGSVYGEPSLLEMAHSQNTLPELNGEDIYSYEGCKDCQWALTCSGGCPIVNASANGIATSSSPYCHVFKEMIPRLLELRALQLINSYSRLRKEVSTHGR